MKIQNLTLYIFLLLWMTSCNSYHPADRETKESPSIFPDYTAVTFPINIAPPNFIIQEEGEDYQVEMGIVKNTPSFIIHSNKPTIQIPHKKWKELLHNASGKDIYSRISILQDNQWVRYADITNTISAQPIDEYLVYRLLYPGYELWNEMGIYQRNLSSYEETPIVENRNFSKQCVNCHTFNKQSPDDMMMHIRGAQGGTLIQHNGKLEKVNPKAEGFNYGPTYGAWHPSGKYIAFSTNKIQQFFHSSGQKAIEVADLGADLMIYNVENHCSFTDSLVYGDTYMETFPAWSPNGEDLYFTRAQGYQKGISLDSIRYDLCKVSFDVSTEKLGIPEILFQASAQSKSVSFPNISPNGKFLMFALSDYGNFSIWHPESDLYLMDLTTGEIRHLTEVNSDNVDSYHTWSSNGYWFVFSSKRMDGLWAHPYFASFNPETGEAGKPFLLPQEDPTFYNNYTYTFNRPELIKEAVRNGKEFEEIIPLPAIKASANQ